MWTQFMDMHSGGEQKEKWQFIYIEAPQEEAKVIFYNKFGHNPERVTCTCCGEDYSITENENLFQLTGFHRNCQSLKTPKDENGLYKNDDPVILAHLYLEKDEELPEGYKLSSHEPFGDYQTLVEYAKNEDVLFVPIDKIKENERKGDVPEQGFIWI